MAGWGFERRALAVGFRYVLIVDFALFWQYDFCEDSKLETLKVLLFCPLSQIIDSIVRSTRLLQLPSKPKPIRRPPCKRAVTSVMTKSMHSSRHNMMQRKWC